jgi:hypothetical protein
MIFMRQRFRTLTVFGRKKYSGHSPSNKHNPPWQKTLHSLERLKRKIIIKHGTEMTKNYNKNGKEKLKEIS